MDDRRFRALVVRETGDKKFVRSIEERSVDQLPDGDVLVRVHYSSLNYKDGLSASGNRGVTKTFPHTPGIDCCGVVEQSSGNSCSVGDEVIVTSYDLGMNTPGGFGDYVRVPDAWVVPMPEGLSLLESMIYGTAGFTAAMSVYAIQQELTPGNGEILVTGATGGVGSLAVAILSKLGYKVVAVSGKPEAELFLKNIGAEKVISRQEAVAGNERPLLRPAWSGVVDTVGGEILAASIKATDSQGVVTCCGNVASPELPINVFPFILRGVKLVGIDSQNCPMEHRRKMWEYLAKPWKPDVLQQLCRVVTLDDVNAEIDLILQGGQMGRVIIKVNS